MVTATVPHWMTVALWIFIALCALLCGLIHYVIAATVPYRLAWLTGSICILCAVAVLPLAFR